MLVPAAVDASGIPSQGSSGLPKENRNHLNRYFPAELLASTKRKLISLAEYLAMDVTSREALSSSQHAPGGWALLAIVTDIGNNGPGSRHLSFRVSDLNGHSARIFIFEEKAVRRVAAMRIYPGRAVAFLDGEEMKEREGGSRSRRKGKKE